jgi:adenylate kinase
MESTSRTSPDHRDRLDHERDLGHGWRASWPRPAFARRVQRDQGAGRSSLQLVILGPPGAGKGTQSVRLARRFGLVHVSTGDLLRTPNANAQAQPYMARGELVPDSVILELLAARLAQDDVQQRGFVLDGFPRTLDQARTLDALIAPGRIDRVVELLVDVDTARPRLHHRGRDDDTPSTIAHRFVHYERETRAISRWYEARHLLLRVDGSQTMDAVTARLLGHLDWMSNRTPNANRAMPAMEHETIE